MQQTLIEIFENLNTKKPHFGIPGHVHELVLKTDFDPYLVMQLLFLETEKSLHKI